MISYISIVTYYQLLIMLTTTPNNTNTSITCNTYSNIDTLLLHNSSTQYAIPIRSLLLMDFFDDVIQVDTSKNTKLSDITILYHRWLDKHSITNPIIKDVTNYIIGKQLSQYLSNNYITFTITNSRTGYYYNFITTKEI
jgi:hypothetical protein